MHSPKHTHPARQQHEPAAFDQRLLAQTIDITLCLPLVYLARSIAGPHFYLWASLALAGYHLYATGAEASAWQATLGKRIAGLKVIGPEHPVPPRGPRLLIRGLAKWLSLLLLMSGFFMIYFSRGSLALHDKISGCRVVRSKSSGNTNAQ